MQRCAFVIASLAAAVLLAGCAGPGDDGGAAGASSPSESSPSATVSSPAPSAEPTDPEAAAGQCADAALAVDVAQDAAGTGAGSIGYRVVITNTGGDACELRGYPGVSVVGGGDGTQLGVPAARPDDVPPQTVTVAPGTSVAAPFQSVNLGGGGGPLGCPTAEGDGWRIYPPHSFRAFFVEAPGVLACTDDEVFLRLAGPVG